MGGLAPPRTWAASARLNFSRGISTVKETPKVIKVTRKFGLPAMERMTSTKVPRGRWQEWFRWVDIGESRDSVDPPSRTDPGTGMQVQIGHMASW